MPCALCSKLIPSVLAVCLAGPIWAQSVGDPIHAWGYDSFGVPGLIDMPSANSAADGAFSMIANHFKNQTRFALAFQFSDRLGAAFRYSITDSGNGRGANYDRSFAVHYRFMDEGDYLPAVAVGMNDILGTGRFAGEYLVASKTFSPRLRGSLGLGWGRLGSYGGFTNPLGAIDPRFETRPGRTGPQGGTLQSNAWFRGDAAFFGGVEWMATDRLRVIAEYSSDSYEIEDGKSFDRKSPLNLGVSWQVNDRIALDARYLYGAELGLQFTYAMNPKYSRHGSGRDAAPMPVLPRHAAAAKTWGEMSGAGFTSALERDLAREGLRLDGIEQDGQTLRIAIQNERYSTATQATGRAARVMSQHAPTEVTRFAIILNQNGMPVTKVTLRRQDLEALEFNPVAGDLLRTGMVIADSRTHLPRDELSRPMLSYGLEPYITPSYFDPDDPLRADVGLSLWGRYEPLPGVVLSGRLQQKLFGNLDQSRRDSDSVLPHVRSDSARYDKGSDTKLPELTAAYVFRPADNVFGRITAGYLESMFGGISAELLWKPQNSALALGIEVNYVRQRAFDDMFGFEDYSVATGHLSAYYEINSDYQVQLDVGRYLAGDIGATVTLAREFSNGWRVAAYATKTDVSAADFGEGAFDKGIMLTIPIAWATGQAVPQKFKTTIRSVQRDGGARLSVPGRLYDEVRGLQASELDESWGRFWK